LIRNGTDPLGQLVWLRNELYAAENNNQSVFIIGHIPPGCSTCISAWSSRYRALIDRFSYLIRGQFFGHTHVDQFEVVRSYKDETPIGVILVAPSLTTFSYHNPSFRVFEIDTDTNTVLNYDQYFLNLTKWNTNTTGPLEWDINYSFLESYNLPDMSPASYMTFLQNFYHNQTLLSLYAAHSQPGHPEVGDVTEHDAQSFYCESGHSVYYDSVMCMGPNVTESQIVKLIQQSLPGRWYDIDPDN